MCLIFAAIIAVTSICVTASHVNGHNTTETVYFSLIYSGGEKGFNSTPAILAIDVALEEIRHQQLLPGYNLTYESPKNSKVLAKREIH